MVAFAARDVVPIYQTPDGRKWVRFEDFDALYKRTRLSADEAAHLEWAAQTIRKTVAALDGKWDSDVSKRNCETMARAVEVINDILEDR